MAAVCLSCVGSGEAVPRPVPAAPVVCGRCGGSGLDPDPRAEWRVDLLRVDDPDYPYGSTVFAAASLGAARAQGGRWLCEVVNSPELECGALFQRCGWGECDWEYVTDLDVTAAQVAAARRTAGSFVGGGGR